MKNGICSLAAIPLRREPSDKSEMTNQVLFGETFSIEDENEKWCMIKLGHDGYEGWVDKKQVAPGITPDNNPKVVSTVVARILDGKKQETIIPAGSLIHYAEGKKFICGNQHFEIEDATCIHETGRPPGEILRQFHATPYLWGGRTVFGMDCSGFTQIVCRLSGKWIMRDAAEQATEGELVPFIEEAQSGDLAFFDHEDGRITHVGIIEIANGSTANRAVNIWHCSGRVRMDALDHQGIFNSETAQYTHRLRLVKRIANGKYFQPH